MSINREFYRCSLEDTSYNTVTSNALERVNRREHSQTAAAWKNGACMRDTKQKRQWTLNKVKE